MIISLSPLYGPEHTLEVTRSGDVLTINGEALDFGPLPAGATLPEGATGCDWVVGDVERDGSGVLRITLALPISLAVFHDAVPDIIDPPDGDISLPRIKEQSHGH